MTETPIEPHDSEDETDRAKKEVEARIAALDGSDVGSDTRAGSLAGGSATGSERDEAQAASDRHLAELGQELKAAEHPDDTPGDKADPASR